MRNTAIGDSASKPRSLVSCKFPVISLKSKSDNFNKQIYRFFAIWQFISAGIVQKKHILDGYLGGLSVFIWQKFQKTNNRYYLCWQNLNIDIIF